jgi:hypothetical protein
MNIGGKGWRLHECDVNNTIFLNDPELEHAKKCGT